MSTWPENLVRQALPSFTVNHHNDKRLKDKNQFGDSIEALRRCLTLKREANLSSGQLHANDC